MKTIILSICSILFAAQLAAAQAERFFLETTDQCCQCWLDQRTGPVTVRVIHEFARDTQKVRFRLVPDPGLNLTYVGETIPLLEEPYIIGYSGTTRDGIEIEAVYSGDRALLATINYVATDLPTSCAQLRLGPHPDATGQSVEIQGVDGVWRTPTLINNLEVLPCGDHGAWCLVTPTEGATWGAIKSLYE